MIGFYQRNHYISAFDRKLMVFTIEERKPKCLMILHLLFDLFFSIFSHPKMIYMTQISFVFLKISRSDQTLHENLAFFSSPFSLPILQSKMPHGHVTADSPQGRSRDLTLSHVTFQLNPQNLHAPVFICDIASCLATVQSQMLNLRSTCASVPINY